MKKVLVCLMALTASVYSWGATSYTLTGSAPNMTLTITGTGAMPTYDNSTKRAPWYNDRASIRYIIIEQGVTQIGKYAFNGISAANGEITVPVSVTTFNDYAFANCTTLVKIKYAGTPNQWANITFSNNEAHPFGKYGASADVKAARRYYLNNQNSATTNLVFTPGITDIKQYAFYNGNMTSVYIPGTVANIRTYALNANFSEVYVNRATPPTLTDSYSISWSGDSKALYVPSGAKSAYNVTSKYWVYSYSYNTTAPASSKIYEQPLSGTVDGQSWSLNANGVLTISGSGALTTSFLKADGASQYPYYYFRYLVDKVVVTGGITGLSNILQRCSAVREIEISQDNIPTSTVTTPTDYIYSQITLRVTKNALFSLDPTTTPWSGKKYALSESVTIDQDVNNATLFTALHKLTEPFNMNLTRSMSNEYYNTFCSPINMDASMVESTFGADTKIYSFAGTSYDEGMDELSLNFNESQDYITAGVPYLIWPENNVSNPSFTDVNPSNVATAEGTVVGDHATFYGALAPVVIPEGGNKNFIFLQANNTLNWASEGTLGGMRAYWLLTTDVPARALAKRPIMKIGNEETGVEQVQSNQVQSTKVIENGVLYIMHNGTKYTIQGMRVD